MAINYKGAKKPKPKLVSVGQAKAAAAKKPTKDTAAKKKGEKKASKKKPKAKAD